MKLIITCEHGGNFIPEKYYYLFEDQISILKTHRAYDIGATDIFKRLIPLADFSISNNYSRLLIELNRSVGSRNLFSEFTKPLTKNEKSLLIDEFYTPYRSSVENYIKRNIKKHKILHLSIHSFTPVLNGKTRTADVGILFNPKSKFEKHYALLLKKSIKNILPGLILRFNYPYLGKADGFTTYLRNNFSFDFYAGIELEFNQKFFKSSANSKLLINGVYKSIYNIFLKNIGWDKN